MQRLFLRPATGAELGLFEERPPRPSQVQATCTLRTPSSPPIHPAHTPAYYVRARIFGIGLRVSAAYLWANRVISRLIFVLSFRRIGAGENPLLGNPCRCRPRVRKHYLHAADHTSCIREEFVAASIRCNRKCPIARSDGCVPLGARNQAMAASGCSERLGTGPG